MNAVSQYRAVKAENPDAIGLVLNDRFYESFDDDARTISRKLGLALTVHTQTGKAPLPMSGFPSHHLAGYVGKLIAEGFAVLAVNGGEQ